MQNFWKDETKFLDPFAGKAKNHPIDIKNMGSSQECQARTQLSDHHKPSELCDARKTSILSRQWRHHWRNITRLVFDDEFYELEVDFDSESEVNSLVMRIQRALQVHDGPITEFVLSISGLTAAADNLHLVSYLSNKGISALSLLFDFDQHSYGEEISSSVFLARKLDSLKLQACKLKVPPWFVGFTRLTVLQLEMVCLPDDFFQSFLLECPLLEDLRASYVVGPSKLEIVGPPRLKVCIFRAYRVLETISFSSTPLLSLISIQAEMYVQYVSDTTAVDIVSTFVSLPALQQLNLSFECLHLLAAGPVPDRFPMALHHLEVLDIGNCYDDQCLLELEVLLCLIRSSPNLYKLTIQDTRILDGLNVERELTPLTSESNGYPDPEAEGSYCQSLTEVHVRNGKGSRDELDLLRFLLANAPRLSRIVIKPEYKLSWGSCVDFLEKVRQCECVSKEAEIIYVNMSDVILLSRRLTTS
ncbi:unnamed protein product [Linum tenue]|uniref:F-box/LRR-repeat protein 15/At3g58940/PEG3-like LRR domain-containing protein n=2 Tax=Linum tenue TaxID=586396 RepID=A0AAV0NJL7_9ROSI|nr:unnamed protein product [Linum tenue]